MSPAGDVSVVVLKPDGFESREVRGMVRKLLAANELQEVLSYPFVFTEDDVLDVWPKFGAAKYPLSRLLSTLYMTSGRSEIIVVHGSDTPSRVDRIKEQVRGRHGAGMFCNHIHTPTGPVEVAAAMAKFAPCASTSVPGTRHSDTGETEGIWGRLGATRPEALRVAAVGVWARRAARGWDALRRSNHAGPHVAILEAGDPHSIDYGMSVLAELSPTWSLDEVIRTYLEADVFGDAIVREGSRGEVDEVRDVLLAHGLRARSA